MASQLGCVAKRILITEEKLDKKDRRIMIESISEHSRKSKKRKNNNTVGDWQVFLHSSNPQESVGGIIGLLSSKQLPQSAL